MNNQPPAAISPQPDSLSIRTPSGVTISARSWTGEGREDRSTIVLAHGGGQTHHSWGGTAATLARAGHRVVTFDLRGHGESTWAADGDYSHAAFGQDAIAVAQWCGEPVIWIGASLGGISGLVAIDTRPELFAALVLVDITHRPSSSGVDRILSFMKADLEHGFATLEEAADAVAAYQPHRQRPPSTAGLAKNLRRGEDERWRWHWDPAFLSDRSEGTTTDDHWAGLHRACQRLERPTLLIRGRLSDLVTDSEVAAFRELVPHASFVDVADAAHMIAGDRNDVFTSAVEDFVAELGRSAPN